MNTSQSFVRYRWLIFWILAAQYLVVYFHRVSPAVLAPELVIAFKMSGTNLGLLASAYFYPYGIMQVPVGLLSDSWGSRKTITLFALLAAIGTLLFGLSPWFSFAVGSRVLVGLGVSAIFIPTMRLFSVWFKPVEYARISGAFMAIGGLGWFTATIPLAFLTEIFGWRISVIIPGLATIILSILTWFIVADNPAQKRFSSETKERDIPEERHNNLLVNLSVVLKEKYFWPIAIWFIFRGGALFGFFGLWAGPYLIDIYGFSKQIAGNILSMVAFAMIFVSPVMGHLSDKTFMSRKKILVSTSLLNCVCWLIFVLYQEHLTLIVIYINFFLMGITVSSVGTIAIVATRELFPLRIAGTAMGMMNVFPFIGGVLFQPLLGYILDRAGKIHGTYTPSAYRLIIWILFITSVLALISIMFSKETYKKTR
ncbi:MAG: MFS transporter [Syntrophorhabdus sp.]